ncbi:pimeloyl-ACP methyl ester carboxylesterase [Deinococcus metalli]|uniref:Alpha/beta hydrolase n=1 Tax=Deinococcus metalli TaxID=1141878 RepID=A0A7W8NSE3_9DEIO|nr:alpha/beta fold hydrolase [Deinococcus metalli]MBB5377062.1 pimeloyl-ACP methyl ester carboxylesterase [Deinococcus metalli]GHF49231.1 alpha/beta hydrolase [Deinococcus metalli]
MTGNVESRTVDTARVRTRVLERPAVVGARRRVLLVHGNVSSSAFFHDLLLALPDDVHAVAPDLRGYGGTEPRPVDATRGLRDWSDDVLALMDALGWPSAHLLGWSLGGGVVMQVALDAPGRVQSLTLAAGISPYGFGGTHGEGGTPNAADYAGSGGGTVNAAFVAAVAAGDRSDAPGSPRDVLRKFYVNPAAFTPTPEQEEAWLDAMLSTRTGDDHYPGDMSASGAWPNVAPGTRGVANAFSPKYQSLAAFAQLSPAPPVLWVRGDLDAIVSDASLFDLAQLGALGVVPGWPGAESCPPQPMVTQLRAVLDAAQAGGGSYREVVLPGVGHSPFLEAPDAFLAAFTAHLDAESIPDTPSSLNTERL